MDLATFLFGWTLGAFTLAVACDLRRALISPQAREDAFQRRAQGLRSNSHE